MDGGGTQTVLLMDGFGRRTIKNLKMWTEVDGWTDGRKSVRGGLGLSISYAAKGIILVKDEFAGHWVILEISF